MFWRFGLILGLLVLLAPTVWAQGYVAENTPSPRNPMSGPGFVLVPSAPVTPMGAPQPMLLEPPREIGAVPLGDIERRELAVTAEHVDTVRLDTAPSIDFTTFSNLAQPVSLISAPGAMLMLTPGGLRVFDPKSGSWGLTTRLSSDLVRARDARRDDAGGSVWFYGRDLYQYHVASRQLTRHSAAGKPYRVIRRIALVTGGIWLATDQGLYFYDLPRNQLRTWRDRGGKLDGSISQVTAGASGVWFCTGDGRIGHLNDAANPTIRLTQPVSTRPPIELLARDDGLWLLLSQDNGRGYQLATMSRAPALRLQTSRLTLFSLRDLGGQMFGAAYEQLYWLDSASRQWRTVQADLATLGGASIGNGVVFSGATYAYAYGTAAVERYVLDLSKGWQNPLPRVMFEGWAKQQPAYMLQYLPSVVDVASLPGETWFLLSGEPDSKRDRAWAVRHEAATGRVTHYWSRWQGKDTQPFSVEKLIIPAVGQ